MIKALVPAMMDVAGPCCQHTSQSGTVRQLGSGAQQLCRTGSRPGYGRGGTRVKVAGQGVTIKQPAAVHFTPPTRPMRGGGVKTKGHHAGRGPPSAINRFRRALRHNVMNSGGLALSVLKRHAGFILVGQNFCFDVGRQT